ncbi:MAG: hypothetical protein SO108_03775 [Bacilli bacterium]|nr:hypothetical protein [Bacilli bacterium]
MDVRLVNKYIPFVDRISDFYQYPANIQHLLYLVIPAFIEKYGYKNETLIQNVFQNVVIQIKEDKNSLEEAFYTSIPKLVQGKVCTYQYVILRKYSSNHFIQLLDNLVHEFNHAIHSYRKEIRIENDRLYLRTGLTEAVYTYPSLEGLSKKNTYLLEEILNTIQTEEVINIIKNHQDTTNEEIATSIRAINQETGSYYRSKSYYLETVLFQHVLKNRTFTSTLNNLRLSGDIDDIESWFDHITGIPNSYANLNQYLVDIMNLELEYQKKKYFKGMVLSKIKNLLHQCFSIIDTFNDNCHFK